MKNLIKCILQGIVIWLSSIVYSKIMFSHTISPQEIINYCFLTIAIMVLVLIEIKEFFK